MRIECPRCAAAYDVPERLLTGRKALRCARCGTEWTAGLPPVPPRELPVELPGELPRELPRELPDELPDELPEPDEASPADVIESHPPAVSPPPVRPARSMSLDRPSPTAMQRLVNIAEPPPRPSLWPAAAWAASIIVLALLVWAAFAWRTDIMQAWPPSTRVYAAFGLAQPPR